MSQHSLYRRTKHGSLPGDVGKEEKIAMRERRLEKPGAEEYRKRINRLGNKRMRNRLINLDEEL